MLDQPLRLRRITGELGAMELITCCVPTMWIPGCTWFTIVTTELYRYNSLRVRLFPCFYLRHLVFTLAILLVLSTVPQHSPFFQTHGTQLPSPSEVRDGKLESFQRDPVQSLEARLRKQLLTLKNKNKILRGNQPVKTSLFHVLFLLVSEGTNLRSTGARC